MHYEALRSKLYHVIIYGIKYALSFILNFSSDTLNPPLTLYKVNVFVFFFYKIETTFLQFELMNPFF